MRKLKQFSMLLCLMFVAFAANAARTNVSGSDSPYTLTYDKTAELLKLVKAGCTSYDATYMGQATLEGYDGFFSFNPADPDWTLMGNTCIAAYVVLPDGDYTLKVAAGTYIFDGVKNEAFEIPFTVGEKQQGGGGGSGSFDGEKWQETVFKSGETSVTVPVTFDTDGMTLSTQGREFMGMTIDVAYNIYEENEIDWNNGTSLIITAKDNISGIHMEGNFLQFASADKGTYNNGNWSGALLKGDTLTLTANDGIHIKKLVVLYNGDEYQDEENESKKGEITIQYPTANMAWATFNNGNKLSTFTTNKEYAQVIIDVKDMEPGYDNGNYDFPTRMVDNAGEKSDNLHVGENTITALTPDAKPWNFYKGHTYKMIVRGYVNMWDLADAYDAIAEVTFIGDGTEAPAISDITVDKIFPANGIALPEGPRTVDLTFSAPVKTLKAIQPKGMEGSTSYTCTKVDEAGLNWNIDLGSLSVNSEEGSESTISLEISGTDMNDAVLNLGSNAARALQLQYTISKTATEPEGEVDVQIVPAFIYGEEEISLSDHSNVSVAVANAIKAGFGDNGAKIKYATYSISAYEAEEFMGVVDTVEVDVATGVLNINGFGYAEFEDSLVFNYGTKYNVTIKAWDSEDIFNADFSIKDPIATISCDFNGSFGEPGPEPENEIEVVLVAADTLQTEYTLNTHSTVTIDQPISGIKVSGLDQVNDTVSYAIYGTDKATLAEGILTVNTIGYAEFAPVTMYEGMQYNVVIATKDSVYFDMNVIGAAEPAEIEIDATIIAGEDEIALNSHSAVSAEMIKSIEVTFDGFAPTQAGYSINTMVQVTDSASESSTWEIDETIAQGSLSLNGKGYAELDEAILLNKGTKYAVTVNYTDGNRSGEEVFEINGVYEEQEEASELVEGTYYIQNVESGLFLSGANSWGTQASATVNGEAYAVAALENGGYTITGTLLSSANKTLGYDLFVDNNTSQNGNVWTIAPVAGEDGVYTIYGKGMKGKIEDSFEGYVAQSETAGAVTGYVLEGVAEVTDAAKWRFITKEQALASIKSGDNISFLFDNPNFTRNHATSAWIVDEGCTNKNLGGGENSNFCAESYHSKFNIHQTITGVPNGTYSMTVQGFYRNDFKDGETHEVPVFYANGEETAIPVKTGEENSMANASASFTKGLYTIEPIEFEVTDGTITLGVKSNEAEYWCIWDNFQVTAVEEGAPEPEAPVVAIEEGEGTYTVTSTSADAALYYLCKPMSWLDEGETPESCLQADIEGMGMMIDSEETWELYDHMGMQSAPKAFTVADYQEMYAGEEMFLIAANVGWNGEKLAVISNIEQINFTVTEPQEAEIVVSLMANDSVEYTLNTHSIVTIDQPISAIKVTGLDQVFGECSYAIYDKNATLASGYLAVNTLGYAEFAPVTFYEGNQYNVVISADSTVLFDQIVIGAMPEPVLSLLENGDFAEGLIADGINIATYARDGDVNRMQEVPGWSFGVENGDARAAGVVAYGSKTTLGGPTYGVPAEGPEGTNGNALAVVGVWTGTVKYVQDVKLPAGKYTMTVPVYNTAGTSAFVKNLVGVTIDGAETFATTKTYPVGKWIDEIIEFELEEEKTVTVSLGYEGANVGSGSSQHLFYDRVKLEAAATPEAPEISGLVVNPNKQLVAMHFDAEDAMPTWNVDFALETAEGVAVNTTVEGDYGQDYGDMIYTFGAPLEDGDYVLVLPAGSMTFSLNGTPFNAEIRVPFTVGEGDPEPEVEISAIIYAGEDTIALNTHSNVSVEAIKSIEVTFDGVVPTIAGYSINSLVEVPGYEGSTWEVDETLAQGELSLSGKGYAELEEAILLYAGTKYNVVINYQEGGKNGNFIEFEINGAYEESEVIVKGDVNQDGTVNVGDFSKEINIILDRDYDYDYDIADVNEDGWINVGDVTAISNIILEINFDSLYWAKSRVAQNNSIAAELVSVQNGISRYAIVLNNATPISAIQLDVEGARLAGQMMGARANGQSIMANGSRVIAAGLGAGAFSGNNGTVLYVDVEGAGSLQNIIASDLYGRTISFDSINLDETTGIAITGAGAADATIYSVNGVQNKSVVNGVNIIRKADGTVTKVIVK